MLKEKWDRHFIGLALYHSRMSKDPSTHVGAVIVGPDREVLGAGFNGFPRGIADTAERLGNRDEKLRLIVHAEMNAVLAAARTGMRIKGCTLYLAATDDTGMIWGGPPCTRCTVEVIQSGISEIVSLPVKAVPSRWHEDLKLSRSIITEAGIEYREINMPLPNEAKERREERGVTKEVVYQIERPESNPGLSCYWRAKDFDMSAEFDGAEEGEQIVITLRMMTEQEFKDLGDFDGW